MKYKIVKASFCINIMIIEYKMSEYFYSNKIIVIKLNLGKNFQKYFIYTLSKNK